LASVKLDGTAAGVLVERLVQVVKSLEAWTM